MHNNIYMAVLAPRAMYHGAMVCSYCIEHVPMVLSSDSLNICDIMPLLHSLSCLRHFSSKINDSSAIIHAILVLPAVKNRYC